MKSLGQMSFEELLRPQGHACACGRTHQTGLKFLRVGQGAVQALPEALEYLALKHPFVVADQNTQAAAGGLVREVLTGAGIPWKSFTYPTKERIEPDEYAVGALTMAFDPACDCLLAVGSGVINDCCKVAAHAAGIPSLVVGTAPSMDGYASNSAAMISNRIKVSLYNACPQAIIADTDIMKNAPEEMLWAGLGDMLAKYNALCEWRISHIATGEFYCEEIAALVRASVRKVAKNVPGLMRRDPEAIGAVAEGLILSGVAMDYAKISRPASGLEHYFSHMWEMEELRRGGHAALHGICVGVGLCLTLPLYDYIRANPPTREKAQAAYNAFSQEKWELRMADIFGPTAPDVIACEQKWGKNERKNHQARLDALLDNWPLVLLAMEEELPDRTEILNLMRSTGMPTAPGEIGVDDAMVRRAFIGSRELRDKYLLSSMLWDLGMLDEACDKLF